MLSLDRSIANSLLILSPARNWLFLAVDCFIDLGLCSNFWPPIGNLGIVLGVYLSVFGAVSFDRRYSVSRFWSSILENSKLRLGIGS